LPPLMSLIGVHALPVVNAVTRSLKSTARSRALRIGFDPAADSIRIRSIKIGFDPNSVLESVRTLHGTMFVLNKIHCVLCCFGVKGQSLAWAAGGAWVCRNLLLTCSKSGRTRIDKKHYVVVVAVALIKMAMMNLFRVWSIQTGEMVNTLIHHCEAVLHLRFSDGIMVTCSKVCQFTRAPVT